MRLLLALFLINCDRHLAFEKQSNVFSLVNLLGFLFFTSSKQRVVHPRRGNCLNEIKWFLFQI